MTSRNATLVWNDKLAQQYDDAKTAVPPTNRDTATQVIIDFVKSNQSNQQLDPMVVVDFIQNNHAPNGGWMGFDHTKWLELVTKVIAELQEL